MNNDDLTPKQKLAWQVISIIEVIGIFLFVGSQADMKDPVVAVITSASALAAVFFTRKYVRDKTPE
jgi:hypothetical protein